MPTRASDYHDLNSRPSKKVKRNNVKSDFSSVLLECGVSSILGDRELHNKAGSYLDENLNPAMLRASIHGLLCEMHKNGIDVDNRVVLETMEEAISSGVTEMVDEDAEGSNNKNLLLWKMLLPMTTVKNGDGDDRIEKQENTELIQVSRDLLRDNINTNFDLSLMKILLRVDTLQPSLLTCLLGKLQEIATSHGKEIDLLGSNFEKYACDEELARLIISHIRPDFIVDPMALIQASLECLSVLCTNLFEGDDAFSERTGNGNKDEENVTRSILLDFIAILPDMIDDGCVEQDPELMDNIISTLRDIRLQDPTLLIPCLDAVSSLRFANEDQVGMIISDALEALESVTEPWLLPALCKFLVQNVPRGDNDLCEKVIDTFRRLRLGLNINDSSIDRSQVHEKTDSETLMLEALSQGFMYRSDLTNALINSIKCTAPSQHGASDLWLLLCCGVAGHNKTKVNRLFKAKAVSGGFNRRLLVDVIQGNGAALNHLFDAIMLPLADTLVRSKQKAARIFGKSLYEETFLEFVDRTQRQAIVGQLVIHIASGSSYEEIDIAMKVFTTIVNNGGAQMLRSFLPFLTSLLDNVQNFETPHQRILFLLLFIVGGSDDGDVDEVQIMINKFLATQQFSVKKIGIIGAVSCASCFTGISSPEKTKEVLGMLELVYKSCSTNSPTQLRMQNWAPLDVHQAGVSSMSIFFDELCLATRAGSLPECIRVWILERFSGILENEYLGDLESLDSYVSSSPKVYPSVNLIKDKNDRDLVIGNTNKNKAPKGELRCNIDNEDAVVYLKLLSLHVAENVYTREIMPQQLCPLLRLLTATYDERNGGDGIGNIDALLGCPMLLPDTASSSTEFRHLSEEKQLTTVSSLFSAVSWCREIVNSFVYLAAFKPMNSSDTQMTQEHECTRKKIVQKLECLVDLEEELKLCAKKCYSFTPPGLSPSPVPRELLNVSVCTNAIPEAVNHEHSNESVEPGRMTAEEKKALTALKRAIKKRESDKMKSKQKLLKLRTKHETVLESRTLSALRPLSAHACLALGFPELRIIAGSSVSSSQELMLSLGASEMKNMQVGGIVTNTLLSLFNDTLVSVFQAKSNKLDALSENPYMMVSTQKGSSSKRVNSELEFLKLCINAHVFISMHERLVAAAEILGDNESCDNDTNDADTKQCASLLLKCVTTLLSADELHTSMLCRAYFEIIVKQISDGENNPSPDELPLNTIQKLNGYPNFMRSATALFDLIEEALTGRDTDDLTFTMVGVDCVNAICRRADAIQTLNINENAVTRKQLLSMKTKLAKLCLELMRREWRDGSTLNKNNVGKLVNLYLENSAHEPSNVKSNNHFQPLQWGRLNAIHIIVNEALLELTKTEHCKGPVDSFFTCCRSTFGCYLSSVVKMITKETSQLFQDPISKEKDCVDGLLKIWQNLVSLMVQTFDLTKMNPSLRISSFLLIQLKNATKFMEVVLKRAIPYCVTNFHSHGDFIINIIENIQKITRQMSFILSYAKRVKDSNLVAEGPKVRKVCEGFIHMTKALMQKNGVLDALWGGNLTNKDIDGTKIDSDVDSNVSADTESEEDD